VNLETLTIADLFIGLTEVVLLRKRKRRHL